MRGQSTFNRADPSSSILADDHLDLQAVRSHFPALQQKQVFLDNAGGSQVLSDAINSIRTYLEETNVQLGASYNIGQKATEKYNQGFQAAADFLNAGVDEIVIGPSTTQLFANLAQSLALSLPADAEIICSSIDHEANIASWVRLAKIRNLTLKWWTPSAEPGDLKLTPENLRPLMSEKTKLVTCTHTSNILGTIHDIKAIAEEVHKVEGAMLCVDGVAYAPHREIDVKELGVDFYSFSWYKVYGPHIALLYASPPAQKSLTSLGHYFHPTSTLAHKLGLAAASYELVSTIPSILAYFGADPKERKQTWRAIAEHEQRLQTILLDYLIAKEGKGDGEGGVVVVVYGERSADMALRVPVVSFSVKGRGSKGVVEKVDGNSEFGIRWGHFYSKRLVEGVLGLGEEGVVRVSCVHYNTG
ncbi:hypothetical protein Q9189_005601 [Teloschistes chrysophthalmus]